MQDILLFAQHHLALCAVLAAVLTVLVIIEFIKLKRGANYITPARTTQLINHHKATVVDIRSKEMFLAGHIAGAVSLPASEAASQLKKIEKLKANPVIITCGAGTESPKIADLLTQQGFDVQILSGGIRAWRDAQLPLVKG